MTDDFDIYRWRADMERALGVPAHGSLWQAMYPAVGEPKLDPKNNRTIRVERKPEVSEWARLRRMLTPTTPTRQDLGGCITAVVLMVVAFVVGRCS